MSARLVIRDRKKGSTAFDFSLFTSHLSLLLVFLELFELLELLCRPGRGKQAGFVSSPHWDRCLVPGDSGFYESVGGQSNRALLACIGRNRDLDARGGSKFKPVTNAIPTISAHKRVESSSPLHRRVGLRLRADPFLVPCALSRRLG